MTFKMGKNEKTKIIWGMIFFRYRNYISISATLIKQLYNISDCGFGCTKVVNVKLVIVFLQFIQIIDSSNIFDLGLTTRFL